MFELIFAIILIGYFIQTVAFIIGANKQFKKISYEELPTVTVVVAARNEERNIMRTLNSLAKLEYPENKLEIILVDDQSTDATGKIIDDFIINKSNFKKITTNKENIKLIGKVRGLPTVSKKPKVR
jgi:cellulose synthase/poly-beta-1,6-N-acetylglucosamine synthase-like glycosyltransferase